MHVANKICMLAAIGVPIGLSTHGTPVGMQFFGPPGWDQVNLNLLSQLQNIFDPIPPPPNPSLCAGCTADVSVIPVGPMTTVHHSS